MRSLDRRCVVGGLGLMFGGVLAGWQGAAKAQMSTDALRLGLAPFLSPAALLAVFRPVREHLQSALGQPVQAYTARDFTALVAALRAGEYDLALVPAHLARLATQDWQWVPMAATLLETPLLVLVRRGSALRAPADLAGQRVGMLDALSLAAARATTWAQAQGLALEVVTEPSINSALVDLSRGHVAAVVAAESQLRGLPADTPADYVVLTRLAGIPGPQYIARPGLPAAALRRLQAALAAVPVDPARPTTAANSRLTPLTEALLGRVDAEAAVLRRQLSTLR
jgi:phosphonate transport system substrate-binding protein